MGSLFQEISEITEQTLPFHMPGHKRNEEIYAGKEGAFLGTIFSKDVTEIASTDDLHHPEGVIKEAQDRAAALYGAKKSFFLINGSTAGVLSMISAAVPFGGKLLLPRASHKSVYHACALRHITPIFLPQRSDSLLGFAQAVRPEDVESALQDSEVDAVLLTSPTYEGFCTDIASVASIVHKKGIPLLVDGAHGAHLTLWREETGIIDALHSGADLVVHSLHKTLPSPNQTGLLHMGSERISLDRVQYFLGVYQTSSPSYPLMIGIDSCINWMQEVGKVAFTQFAKRRENLHRALSECKQICVLDYFGGQQMDPCKVVLYDKTGANGPAIEKILRRAGIEPELTAPGYVLLIMTPFDEVEAYNKLARVVNEADGSLPEKERKPILSGMQIERSRLLWEAIEGDREKVALTGAEGKISSEMVMLYPPGQPLILPGEIYTKQIIETIRDCICNSRYRKQRAT